MNVKLPVPEISAGHNYTHLAKLSAVNRLRVQP
jgi:hypothetical protein